MRRGRRNQSGQLVPVSRCQQSPETLCQPLPVGRLPQCHWVVRWATQQMPAEGARTAQFLWSKGWPVLPSVTAVASTVAGASAESGPACCAGERSGPGRWMREAGPAKFGTWGQ